MRVYDPSRELVPGIDPAVGHRPPETVRVVVAIGVLAAMVLYVVGVCVQKSYAASFFAAPTFVGAVVGLLSLRRPFRSSWFALGIALLVGIVTLREGVVCVVFSLPILAPALMLGTACGWTVRRFVRARRNRYFAVTFVMLVGLCWQVVEGRLDDPSRHPEHTATTSLDIPASPPQVFAALTGNPIEVPSRWPWFLRIGLPLPRRMEVLDPGPQGRLRVDFSQGAAHGHVTEWSPGRGLAFTVDRYEIHDLPFHITRLGRGPHWGLKTERAEDWLTFLELRYTLAPTASGGTVLTRETRWRRHLAPAFYFGWLQQTVMERGQQRLLELIRGRVAATAAPYVSSEASLPGVAGGALPATPGSPR